jgi:glyoxylase-like metal-dependent hydrolase (beta-lactamase superfamily II)
MRRPALLAAAIAGLVLCSPALVAGSPTRIDRDTYLVPGAFPKDQQPDGNSIVLVAPQGLIVVDTGRHARHTQQIVDFARSQERPIVAIVNTHWHLDHIGGNLLLREQYPGVRIHASDALRGALQGFLGNYRDQLEQAIAQAKEGQDVSAWRNEIRLIDGSAQLAPDQTIADTSTLSIAGRKLTLHLERNAATAGDIWVEDPASRIVLTGDLVTLPVPFFDTACPEKWEATLNRVAQTSFTTLIPGHGAPMKPQDFAAYRKAYSALLACAASTQPAAACAQQWIGNAGALLSGDDRTRVAPMLDYYMQVVLRNPKGRPGYCST